MDVIPFIRRPIFTSDSIGIRTLQEAGKLIIVVKPHVHHLAWHTRRDVIHEVIFPYLD